ncbi:hypothetical protein OFC56_36545, partial [Escherichia coli]|nr:hypothetical protein [Escherichia coli]
LTTPTAYAPPLGDAFASVPPSMPSPSASVDGRTGVFSGGGDDSPAAGQSHVAVQPAALLSRRRVPGRHPPSRRRTMKHRVNVEA